MTEDPCPRCRGTDVAVLDAAGPFSGPLYAGFVLRPRHCKGGAAPPLQFSACLACGLVWPTVDPEALRTAIRSQGDELARQRLDALDRGPFRDLPDSDAARDIAAAIAEIDALIYSRRNPVRRYRELRGVTWDQAHADVKAWPGLTREQKLELFGWPPSKKRRDGSDPDFDAPFH